MYILTNWIKKNKFLIFLFLFSFLIRLCVVITINTPIISDFKTMYDASIELLNGTHEYRSSSYFLTWGYQMGHVIYQTILLHIFNSTLFLKIINSIITSFIVVFVYLICKKIASEKVSKIISILYSIFLFPLLLNTVLTNQHLPLLLILISIYIISSIDINKFIKKSLIIGLLLGLSNIFRSETIVVIGSIFIYYLYLIIKKHNIKNLICSFLIIFISYNLIFNITSSLLIKTNISTNGLKNMNPTWKFVLGFNYETNGKYNDEDAALYSTDKEKAKIILKERLKEFDKIPILFKKKSKTILLDSDLSWSIGHINNSNVYITLNYFNKLFILFFTSFSIASIFKKKKTNTQILITIVLILYIGSYLLIEVMPRYSYSLQVFEAILASITLDFIIKHIKKFKITA